MLIDRQAKKKDKRLMGYKVRIQKVDRQTTCSYYVNFPVAVAEAIEAQKAEEWEWCLEDLNTLVFKRANPKPSPRKTSHSKTS